MLPMLGYGLCRWENVDRKDPQKLLSYLQPVLYGGSCVNCRRGAAGGFKEQTSFALAP